MLRFLSQFQAEYQRTKLISKRLRELNLLEPKQAEAKLPNGKTKAINGFSSVERSRILTLPAAVLLDLMRKGVDEMICHHLGSLRNVQTLGSPTYCESEPLAPTAPLQS